MQGDVDSDDEIDDVENAMDDADQNEENDLNVMTQNASTVTKKRSSSSLKTKSHRNASKRIRLDEPLRPVLIDDQQLDASTILNYMKEMNQHHNQLFQRQKQIMLSQDRMETTLKSILKNQKQIAKAMNNKNVGFYGKLYIIILFFIF